MPWGAAVGAGISLLGNAMQSDKNGGAGSSTTSKEPWALAQPWLANNLLLGQNMQSQYLAQPIDAKQQQATNNQYALSDYMRGEIPSLLSQLQNQPLGYDRANPTAKAKAFDWSLLGGGGVNGLNQGSVGGAQQAPAPAAPASKFTQQGALDPMGQYQAVLRIGDQNAAAGGLGGGYGSFKYGMPMPAPGTPQYRDMQEYFLNGGLDQYNFYGRGAQFGGGGLLRDSTNSGNSIGGSPSGDGSGGGNAGVF